MSDLGLLGPEEAGVDPLDFQPPGPPQTTAQLDFAPEELFGAYSDAEAEFAQSTDERPLPMLDQFSGPIPQQDSILQRDTEVSGLVNIDPVEVARKVQRRTQDDVELALNAARVDRHAKQHANGVAGVAEDLARIKDLSDTDKLAGKAGPRVRELWAKFTDVPTSLTDEEELELFQSVRNIADSETRGVTGDTIRVDVSDEGVIEHHEWPEGMTARSIKTLPEVAVASSVPRKRFQTSLPTGEVVYGAEIDAETASKMNHLYPALVGKSDVPLWLDSRPSFVQDVETIRRRVDTDDKAHGEMFLNTDLAKNGAHFSVANGIVVELERGQKLRLPRDVPPAVEIGVAEVDRWDDEEQERVRVPVRKVLIQPGPDHEGKLGELADELEIRGGKNPSVYQHGGSVKGFQRVREHVWTDGVQTYAAQFRDDDLLAPNGGFVWVRSDDSLPSSPPPVGDEHKDLGDGLLLLNGAVLVDTDPDVEPAGNPFNVKRDGQKPVALGIDPAVPPVIVPLWDEVEADQFPAAARRVGREVQVSAKGDDLAPAVEAAHVLRSAAVPASPLVVRSASGRLALPSRE